ncbi:MAG TPA: arsenite methyltransferase [Chloroflexota bacterium]
MDLPTTESTRTTPPEPGEELREAVRARYAAAALTVLRPDEVAGPASCCGPAAPAPCRQPAAGASCCDDQITSNLYSDAEAAALPGDAVRASLGCGNPTALIDLRPGEVVLDLGSGGGIDVLLSAGRVGAGGRAYGLDMTDEMLALARKNAAEVGASNVEFLKGRIEAIPLPDDHVDVVISNCVINLSSDKARVLREAFRVLKPGGRFAVSDVVVDGPVPADLRRRVELWVGCIAGALERTEYERLLRAAGFGQVEIVPTRRYDVAEAPNSFMSAFVRAVKPAR